MPHTESNQANYDYTLALEAKTGIINKIYKNWDRNIVVNFGKWNNYVYLNKSNIKALSTTDYN